MWLLGLALAGCFCKEAAPSDCTKAGRVAHTWRHTHRNGGRRLGGPLCCKQAVLPGRGYSAVPPELCAAIPGPNAPAAVVRASLCPEGRPMSPGARQLCPCGPGRQGSQFFALGKASWQGKCTDVPLPDGAVRTAEGARCRRGYRGAVTWSQKDETYLGTCEPLPCPPNAVFDATTGACRCTKGSDGAVRFDEQAQRFVGHCYKESEYYVFVQTFPLGKGVAEAFAYHSETVLCQAKGFLQYPEEDEWLRTTAEKIAQPGLLEGFGAWGPDRSELHRYSVDGRYVNKRPEGPELAAALKGCGTLCWNWLDVPCTRWQYGGGLGFSAGSGIVAVPKLLSSAQSGINVPPDKARKYFYGKVTFAGALRPAEPAGLASRLKSRIATCAPKSRWSGNDYNLLTNNCNAFTSTLLKCVLGLNPHIPGMASGGLSNLGFQFHELRDHCRCADGEPMAPQLEQGLLELPRSEAALQSTPEQGLVELPSVRSEAAPRTPEPELEEDRRSVVRRVSVLKDGELA